MELEFTPSITAFAKPQWGALCRAAALVGTLSFAGSASAFVDPNFAICSFGTIDPTTCNGDPNSIGTTGVTAAVRGGAGDGPLDPFLLLIVSSTANPAPTLGSGIVRSGTDAGQALTLSFATTAMYGQTNTPTNGLLSGLFTSASGNLYDYAGLIGGNASIKVTSGSFNVWEVLVSNAVGNFNPDDIFDIGLGLTAGDLVAAWGIECNPTGDCPNSAHVYATPFTTAGLVTSSTSTSGTSFTSGSLPEPGTLALLGLGMLGLTFSRKLGSRR